LRWYVDLDEELLAVLIEVLGFDREWAESLERLEAPALSCYISLDQTIFAGFVHMFGRNAG
jgi:hypothetical protein